MTGLWTTLLPLAVGSAILPIQVAITILLLRSAAGRSAAVAWVAGMTVVRLAQWIVFGVVLGTAATEASGAESSTLIESALLLLIGVLFFVTAARKLLDQPDEDAPAPRWMAIVGSATPGRALLLGAGIVGTSPKLWAFTLGAVGAIVEAGLGQSSATLAFLVFVVAAESIHLGAIGLTFLAPDRSGAWLDQVSEALARHNRVIMTALGLVFGTWFVAKALGGLGVL